MKFVKFFKRKKKKSTFKVVLIVAGVVVAVAAALVVAYKLWGKKLLNSRKVLGEVDLDGDGETDALMLDTTGNGEVDTIVIQANVEDDE